MPVLVWMTLIFVASADQESGPRGMRLLVPLIRWVAPDLPDEALNAVVLIIRKVVHLVTFGVLAGLIWRALGPGQGANGTRRRLWLALVLTAAYAVTDEIHQQFVPTRVGSLWDVVIDTLGAAVALFGIRRIEAGRRRP